MSDVQKAQVGIERSDDGQFVHFGIIGEHAFHPFQSLRAGDYDEAEAAAAEAKLAAKGNGK
jgi:hypothetical protein